MKRIALIATLLIATSVVALAGMGAGDEGGSYKVRAIFENAAFWKKLGEEYEQPLIITGTIMFTPQQHSGFVNQNRETYDNLVVDARPLYQWSIAFPAAATRPLGIQNISNANRTLRDSYTPHRIRLQA